MHRTGYRLLILILLILSTAHAYAGGKRIVVKAQSADHLDRLLSLGASLEQPVGPDGTAVLFVPDPLEQTMSTQGWEYEILIEDVAEYARQRIAPPVGSAPSSKPVELDHFLTYEEMQTFLFDLEARYPELVDVTEAGTTTLGRTMYLVKVSDNVALNEDEPEVFFEGQIHGDEIAGYMLSLHTIQYLVTQYGHNKAATDRLDNLEIFFLPATNSDGAFNSQRVRYNAHGVDLNRDSGYMWHANGNSKAPYGELETRVLFSVWQDHAFVFQTSWHAGTLAMSLPWSYLRTRPPDWDEHAFLGLGYCEPNPMINRWFQGSLGMYQMHGSTKDAQYGSFGGQAWTIELSYIKQITWTSALRVIESNHESVLWLLDQANTGLRGTITDATTSEPVAAVIDIEGKQVAYNDPELGDLHRFILPGIYTITLWANGYEPVILEDVIVPEKGALDISTALEPDNEFGAWANKWLYNFSSNDKRNHALTKFALGPPDGRFYSIGHSQVQVDRVMQSQVVLDLGPSGIHDAPGDDLLVFEGNNDGPEPIRVFASTEPFPADWTLLGEGSGNCRFDLAPAGLAWVRYVRIEDLHAPVIDWFASSGDGYDLDAVGTPSIETEPDDDDDNDDDTHNDDDDQSPLPESSGDNDNDEQNGCGC